MHLQTLGRLKKQEIKNNQRKKRMKREKEKQLLEGRSQEESHSNRTGDGSPAGDALTSTWIIPSF